MPTLGDLQSLMVIVFGFFSSQSCWPPSEIMLLSLRSEDDSRLPFREPNVGYRARDAEVIQFQRGVTEDLFQALPPPWSVMAEVEKPQSSFVGHA